ncbi:hypothetical protein GVX81_06285 [[Haemophilus] felis]|uniref:Uncharacterized protein n=1 Tax=[Haemophilus] felis TaxID=123822 RepID=A0A1T0B884_9PAST|nr:hypothetical protein [[Haemophilus] felis]NBI40784.1 hypothetical protein [[Haemophilus] felis]OOS06139.1 hypothetical protein B0188_02715 [[Haemophilus] felis]
MKRTNLPSGFSGFSWAIAIFCIPVLLWPLALTISPNLLKNPNLSETASTLMSVFLWIYPFCLAIIARCLYLLYQRKSMLARQLLVLSYVVFYLLTFYVATGFA